jgi:uncharacterized protein involved in exopolysaccharide biosynthesis
MANPTPDNGGLAEAGHLREYLRIARKHLKVIVVCCVLVVGTAAVGTHLQRPVYQATTKVMIDRDVPRVVNFQDANTESLDFYQTRFLSQLQIIRSRPVVQRVMDSMRLMERKPELAEAVDPVAAFLGGVRVEYVRQTRLVDIHVEDHDPKLAAEIANTLASAYTAHSMELKLTSTRDAMSWLTTQVSDFKTKINESEMTLHRYQEEAGLIPVEERQSIAARNLAEFNRGYVETRAKRLELETQLGELRKASQRPEVLESSPVVINNPHIQRLKGQLVDLEVQRSRALKAYRPKHPEILEIQTQIDEVAKKIKQEVTRLVASLESEYNALKARETAMQAAVNQYRDEVQRLGKKEIQSDILKRDAISNQQLYEVLLKRLKESDLIQGLTSENIRIVEPAITPIVPVKPRKVLNLALASAVGLGLGLLLAFFLEYMDDMVRTPEQVSRALGVPVLALIPVVRSAKRA